MNKLFPEIFLLLLAVVTEPPAFCQKISVKELLEQPSNVVLIENFYQIKLDDYNAFTSNSSTGFAENDKCFIQNFQNENGLKGQLIIQLDFAGKTNYIGISKVFIDRYKKIVKPKTMLIYELEGCYSGLSSNWSIANCMANKIVLYIGD